MTTYYVDYANGSDANNGLGPDASHATNKPWKTITKLLGAAGMASGDTAYLAPGVFRETVSVAMTSATVETLVIGDVRNSQGFKTAGGVRLNPGEVRLTAFTTNDKTQSVNTTLLALQGRDYLTFRSIVFVGGRASPTLLATNGLDCLNITFTDCALVSLGTAAPMLITNLAAVPLNWLFDRCRFVMQASQTITLTRHLTADYDVNIMFRNCTGTMGQITTAVQGGDAFNPGGILIIGCTFLCFTSLLSVGTNWSTTIPCKVENCTLIGMTSSPLVLAATAGQLTEQYNLFLTSTPRNANVSAGAGSVSGAGIYAPGIHFGQERIWGGMPRHFLEPTAGSPLLGFGSSASAPAVDLFNRPRPSGGASALKAVGAMERGNTFTPEATTIRNGTTPISITGPGYQEFLIPVPASVARTISVWTRWDATYAGTKPQLQIDADGNIGLAAETVTAVGASGAWEQLTLSAFTPTRAGLVRVRVLSSDTNGAGRCYADDFAVV